MIQEKNEKSKIKNILIVDDVTYVRLLFLHTLKPLGYSVFQAKSGIEGLDYFQKVKVDLIILDLMLGDIDGVEFLNRLRAIEKKNNLKQVPVIMITAFTYENKIKQAVNYDIISVFYKPIDLEAMLKEIEEAFQGKKGLKDKANKVILVIEGERGSRDKIESILKKIGYNAKIASNGKEALDLLKYYRPDITVINPELKDLDGKFLISGLARMRQETNIMAILNDMEPELVGFLNGLGVTDLVHKPLDYEDFVEKIQSILKERELIKNYNISKSLFDFKHYDFGSDSFLVDAEED